jgi:hypothetical protein
VSAGAGTAIPQALTQIRQLSRAPHARGRFF